MSSLIIELQGEALDKNVCVSDLLRKALVVSRKLKLTEIQSWINNELAGYKDEVPEYRMLEGQVKGWDPQSGWKPILFQNSEIAEILSKKANGQSIAEIENLAERDNNNSTLHMPLSQGTQRKLCDAIGYQTEVTLLIDPSAMAKILDSVRNIILNWALKLEEEGVLGEGLTFSDTEKKLALQNPQNINNFYGTVQNPQIAQGNQETIQVGSIFNIDIPAISEFLTRLQSELLDIELDATKKAEIESEIATVNAQVASPNPKKGLVKESLTSIRSILESASGSAVGYLLVMIAKIISS